MANGFARPARIAVVACLIMTLVVVARPRSVAAVQTQKLTDWIYYVHSTSTSEANTLGCNQGTYDKTHSNKDSLVVLDFGAERFSGSVEGTQMTVPFSDFMSYAQDEAYAEHFAQQYYFCTDTDNSFVLKLAISTTNYDLGRVDFGGGQSWGNVVMAVRNWVGANGYNAQVFIVGGSDIEPAWKNAPSSTNWVSGFAAATVTPVQMIDYGSADGCPQTTANNGPCANGWHQADEWYMSQGGVRTKALPEIYFSTLASEWSMISLYAANNKGGKLLFQGPLDENNTANPNGSSNTAQQAWTQLWTDINNNPSTATNFTFSCEIHPSEAP